MVANRPKVLLGAAPGKPQTRFAFSFVDEASRHSILVGLDLAAMGSQCLLCGDVGQLRPYSHVQLLGSACEGEVNAKDVAWSSDWTFSYNNVQMQSAGPHVHGHESQRFCTTSTLPIIFVPHALPCQYRGTIVPDEQASRYNHACLVHRGGAFGYYHSFVHALPDPIFKYAIRIVHLDVTSWWWELQESFGPDDLGRMHSDVEDAWNNMRMAPVLLRHGNMSMEE